MAVFEGDLRDWQPPDLSKKKFLYNVPQKLSQKEKGNISQKVRDIVNARTIFAPIGCCERCKKNRNGYWTLELSHIDSRKAIEHKTTDTDLLRLCGPSTNSDTCHYFSHSPDGYDWMIEQQIQLMEDKTNVQGK